MKNNKNFLISILVLTFSLILLAGCIFTVAAADTYAPNFNSSALNAYKTQGYGSFNQGVVAPISSYRFYHPSIQYGYPNIDGHPNLDFEKGYEFWHDKSEQVKMVTDSSGNTYCTIIGTKEHSGISSIKFTHSKLKTGDTVGLLYKWRNKNHLRAVSGSITELYEVKNEATDWRTIDVAGRDGRSPLTIWTVDEEDDEGWNIALMRPANPVKEPTGTVPIVYFSVLLQADSNADVFKNTDFDDLQIVKHNESSGNVYDLDGKLLYNINNLPKLEYKDYVFGNEYKDPDPNADLKVDVKDIISGKIDLNDAIKDLIGSKETQKDNNVSDTSAPSAPSSQSNVSSSKPSSSAVTNSSNSQVTSNPTSTSTEQSDAPWILPVKILIVVFVIAIAVVVVLILLKKRSKKQD